MNNKVYGVGVNDVGRVVEYEPQYDARGGTSRKAVFICPYYTRWKNMLRRCYSASLHRRYPTYTGCTTWDGWHAFSSFREWMSSQDWQGNHLDKDILIPGNKLYSPETCVFVSPLVNQFLTDCGRARGCYPLGVRRRNTTGKYNAQCRNPFTGKRESIGHFPDPESAHRAWLERKRELACILAKSEHVKDSRVADAIVARFSVEAIEAPARTEEVGL